jgi:hypothetical protein
VLVIRIISGLLGLLLIGWSVFLYEPEENEIDDTLITWWVNMDDTAKSALRANMSFARSVATVIAKWLDDLFESRLISFDAIRISACLSASSGFLFLLVWFLTSDDLHYYTPLQSTAIAATCASFSAVYFGVAVSKRRDEVHAAFMSVFVVGFLLTFAALVGVFKKTGVPLLGLILGILCDFLVVVLTRASARWMVAGTTTLAFVTAATLNATAGIALLWFPFIFASHIRLEWLATTFQIAGATNIFGAIVSATFVVVSVTVLVHRVFWASLERPLYAMHRFRLFQRRGLLCYAGTVLLAFAIPACVPVLTSIATFKQQ